jgi:hypothetical protein
LAPMGITFSLMEPGAVRTSFMRKGEIVQASTPYASVGEFISGLLTLPPHMQLDTAELAEAIIKSADDPRPALRVALGPGTEEQIRRTLEDRLRAMG